MDRLVPEKEEHDNAHECKEISREMFGPEETEVRGVPGEWNQEVDSISPFDLAGVKE